jgi:type IV fimbrial biogenesis protein FimT
VIRNKQAGFTLIEIIVAFAVFAIVASIAVPGLLSQMPKWRLNGAARQVMGDLMAARMKAVEENAAVTVAYVNNHQYRISSASEQTRDIHANYADVTIDTNFGSITFYPRGTATMDGISLSNSSGSKTITTILNGRVKIY